MNKRIMQLTTLLSAIVLALSAYFQVAGALTSEEEPPAEEQQEASAVGTDGREPFRFLPLYRGFVNRGGRLYYFDENGAVQRGGIVGSEEDGYSIADEDGVCCQSEEIRLAAAYLVHYCEGDTLDEKMRFGFQYMADHFPYVRTYDHPSGASDMAAMAIDMFTNEKGNCYRYAACFACIAKIAGYRTRVVLGTTAGNPHGWVEVRVGKKWLICDPDAQLPSNKLPEYFAYMMEEHCWQITPKKHIELFINENGVAVWR